MFSIIVKSYMSPSPPVGEFYNVPIQDDAAVAALAKKFQFMSQEDVEKLNATKAEKKVNEGVEGFENLPRMKMSDFQMLKVLGKGSFGKVRVLYSYNRSL